MIESIRIYIAKFENTTQCSEADVSDFNGAVIDEEGYIIRNMEEKITPFYNNLDERGLGWHFFSLGNDSIRAANPLCSIDYDVPESMRVSSLTLSLIKGIKMGEKFLKCSVHDLNDQRHYCQFSGDGNMFFSISEETAVVCTNATPLDETDCYNDDVLTGSLFEGKKIEARSTESLKYQLMANMIILCTKVFIDSLTVETMALATISCYGIACTGAGTFGFMKLEINFDSKEMSFHSKIPFQTYIHRTTSAAFIDYSIAYIATKMVT